MLPTMSTRRVTAKIAFVLAIAIAVSTSIWVLTRIGVIPSEIPPAVFYSAILLATGLWLINMLSGMSLTVLLPKVGNRAYSAATLLKFSGYAIVVIAALAVFGVSTEVALAGGTFSGLVIGLAAQPVLSNFFAGLVLLTTGVVKAGDEIRLLSGSFPYQATTFPPYKFFSPDYIYPGYRGRVVEVGLLYSTMTTETGLELKVPNQIILNSGIVNYTPAHSAERKMQVRYEFKIDHDPELVLKEVKKALANMSEVGKIIINEQSDKEYYIVLIEFEVPIREDWGLLKSEILRRLVKVHRSLRSKSA